MKRFLAVRVFGNCSTCQRTHVPLSVPYGTTSEHKKPSKVSKKRTVATPLKLEPQLKNDSLTQIKFVGPKIKIGKKIYILCDPSLKGHKDQVQSTGELLTSKDEASVKTHELVTRQEKTNVSNFSTSENVKQGPGQSTPSLTHQPKNTLLKGFVQSEGTRSSLRSLENDSKKEDVQDDSQSELAVKADTKQCGSVKVLDKTIKVKESGEVSTPLSGFSHATSAVSQNDLSGRNVEMSHKPENAVPKVGTEDILNTPLLSGQKPVIKPGTLDNVITFSDRREDRLLPSISRILNETMSPEAAANLARWEETMIARLGQKGFLKYKNDLFQNGRDFHSMIQRYLLKKVESQEKSAILKACWQSVEPVLNEIKYTHVVESQVVHHGLKYRGIVDCVAEYKGRPMVIEWKHKERKVSNLDYTYDNPLQLMAYLGALNSDERYPYQVEECLLVIAYTDGSPAQLYNLSKEEQLNYWQAWLRRLQQFSEVNRQQNLIPQVPSDSQYAEVTSEPKSHSSPQNVPQRTSDQNEQDQQKQHESKEKQEKPSIWGSLWKMLK